MNVINQATNVISIQNASIFNLVIIALVNRLFMAMVSNVIITTTVGVAHVINTDHVSRRTGINFHVCVWNRYRNGSVMVASNAYVQLDTNRDWMIQINVLILTNVKDRDRQICIADNRNFHPV